MSEVRFIRPDPQDWPLLQQIADIDAQAFGSDGISVFNLSQFTRCGGVFCLLVAGRAVAEAVLLRNLHDNGAVVFGFAVNKREHGKGYGGQLVKHLVAAAVENGLAYLELTVNPENLAALELYIRKAGFYKKAELSRHPQKNEPRWLLRLDLLT